MGLRVVPYLELQKRLDWADIAHVFHTSAIFKNCIELARMTLFMPPYFYSPFMLVNVSLLLFLQYV